MTFMWYLVVFSTVNTTLWPVLVSPPLIWNERGPFHQVSCEKGPLSQDILLLSADTLEVVSMVFSMVFRLPLPTDASIAPGRYPGFHWGVGDKSPNSDVPGRGAPNFRGPPHSEGSKDGRSTLPNCGPELHYNNYRILYQAWRTLL